MLVTSTTGSQSIGTATGHLTNAKIATPTAYSTALTSTIKPVPIAMETLSQMNANSSGTTVTRMAFPIRVPNKQKIATTTAFWTHATLPPGIPMMRMPMASQTSVRTATTTASLIPMMSCPGRAPTVMKT